jgi:hypothetical protein
VEVVEETGTLQLVLVMVDKVVVEVEDTLEIMEHPLDLEQSELVELVDYLMDNRDLIQFLLVVEMLLNQLVVVAAVMAKTMFMFGQVQMVLVVLAVPVSSSSHILHKDFTNL